MFFFFFFDKTNRYLLGEGRICDIISALKIKHSTNDLKAIETKDKLDFMCAALNLSHTEFDCMIASNSPVLRTVKGHAFEVAMEYLYRNHGISVKDIGGDTDIDQEVNGHTLQLKTPNEAGTSGSLVEYKTHKTHGAKSENESMDYYHSVDSFADFFMGLISYEPLKVFILPKERLERHPKDEHYIKSPFKLSTNSTRDINHFHLLGINADIAQNTGFAPGNEELLPQTSARIGLNSAIIIDTILRNENFRIWDMSIRGFAREVVLKRFLNANKIPFDDHPARIRPERGNKSDLAIQKESGSFFFIQVKGVSGSNCLFRGKDSMLAIETQLTRGRINDHPTQSRLYLVSDFDYLIIGVDPAISHISGLGDDWYFAIVPSAKLQRHKLYPNRYKAMQHFSSEDLLKFELTADKINQIKKE